MYGGEQEKYREAALFAVLVDSKYLGVSSSKAENVTHKTALNPLSAKLRLILFVDDLKFTIASLWVGASSRYCARLPRCEASGRSNIASS